MDYFDFRSDTVTKPTEAMWKAMSEAKVGDDVYQEDPTVNQLEKLSAEKLGKEAGLFVPSGTMGNLIAVLTHCGRGDEVIMGTKAHTFLFEAGGISALGGVHPHTIPNNDDGTLLLNDIKAAIRSVDDHFPLSKLIILENTQNRCGGAPLTPSYTQSVKSIAKQHGLNLHLDGARVFNAAVAQNVDVKSLTDPVDSVTFCLSKGLCAPVGSVLCGAEEFIRKARRIRKQLGGGMRQAGVIAAAGIVALETMIDRLADDHENAKILAKNLSENDKLRIDMNSPKTNMVYVSLAPEVKESAREIEAKLRKSGVFVGVVAERQFRLVTHYWINERAIEACVKQFGNVLNP